jgi:NADPH:quinone reductase-like Zn-dependent oxidoreductase
MPQCVRGVVALAKGEPVTVGTIVVPDPGPGEAVVKVQACAVCHADLHSREGGAPYGDLLDRGEPIPSAIRRALSFGDPEDCAGLVVFLASEPPTPRPG